MSLRAFSLATVFMMLYVASGVHAAEPVTIRWVAAVDQHAAPTHEYQAEVWNRHNPHVQLVFENWPQDGYVDRLMVAIVGGTPPDIFQVGQGPFADMASQEMLLDLQPYVERTNFHREFFPPAIQAFSWAGRVHGIPREGGPSLVHYNIDAFDESGLALPTPEWTWSDYSDAARRAQRTAQDGTVTRFGTFTRNAWSLWVYSNGGQILNDDFTALRLHEPEAVDAIEWVSNLTSVLGVQPTPSEQGNVIARFEAGEYAMRSGPRSNWFRYSQNTSVRWSMELHPQGSHGLVSELLGNALVIAHATQHPDEAFEVLSWLLGVEGWQVRMDVAQQIGVPLNMGVMTDERFLRNGEPYLSVETNLRIAQAIAGGRYVPTISEWPDVNRVITQALNRVWDGTGSPRTELEALRPEVDAILSSRTGSER